jgi:hypothetical protein
LLGDNPNDLVTTAPAPLLAAQLRDEAVLPNIPAASMVGFLILMPHSLISSIVIP